MYLVMGTTFFDSNGDLKNKGLDVVSAMIASTQTDCDFTPISYHDFDKLDADEKGQHLFIVTGVPRRKSNENFPAASVAKSLRGSLRVRFYADAASEPEMIKTRDGRLIEGQYLEEIYPELFDGQEGPEPF